MQARPDWEEMFWIAEVLASRYVKTHDEQEDLKSIAIEKLLKVWRRFKESAPANFSTWSNKVMRNAMVEYLRKSNPKGRPVRYLTLRSDYDDSKADLIKLHWPRIKSYLKPAECRVCQVYAENGDLTYDQIAVLAGVRNASSVRVHVCRIFKTIYTLEKQGL
jgi:RNA polymerase sigma factor (sigma-70 family)